MVVFTLALVVTTYLQWKAAQQAIQQTRESLRITERPYALVNNVRVSSEGDSVEVLFSNSGRSPAIDLTFQGRVVIMDWPDLALLKAGSLDAPIAVGVLGPGSSAQGVVITDKHQFPTAFTEVKAGIKHAYVFGLLNYRDLFGRSYAPRFCFTFDASTGKFLYCPANQFTQASQP